MKKFLKLATGLLSVTLVLGAGSRARAELLQLSFSDLLAGYTTGGMSLETATTLGGVPLTNSVPFTFTATFDTTTGFLSPWGDNLYPIISFTMTIDGTNYTGIPNSNLNVMLSDPSITGGWGFGTGVGIADADGSGNWYNDNTFPNAIIFGYTTATPPLNTSAPTPTIFSDPNFFCYSTIYNIPLVGVPGGLQLNNGANGYAITYPQYSGTNAYASISSPAAIPEPGAMSLAVLGLGSLLLLGRLRIKS